MSVTELKALTVLKGFVVIQTQETTIIDCLWVGLHFAKTNTWCTSGSPCLSRTVSLPRSWEYSLFGETNGAFVDIDLIWITETSCLAFVNCEYLIIHSPKAFQGLFTTLVGDFFSECSWCSLQVVKKWTVIPAIVSVNLRSKREVQATSIQFVPKSNIQCSSTKMRCFSSNFRL